MINQIILPTLSRKDVYESMKLAFDSMGLLAINYFNSNFKNFLKLFFDQIDKNNPTFTEFDMSSLLIIFDSILQNNLSAEDSHLFTGTIEEKINFIIKKYLYHNDPNARLIAFVGLCKLLIANRIGKPEFVIARLITVLYKSFDFTERKDEDHHCKIFEIMQNFLYTYCYTNQSHIKSVIKAILIILTSHLISEGNNLFDKTIASTFSETKVEFLNQLLMVVHDFASGHSSIKKILFKIFKYIYFFYNYALGDIMTALRTGEDYKKNKKIEMKNKIKDKIMTNIKKFFERSKYDKYLKHEMEDESSFLKLFPFILLLDDKKNLKNFSETLHELFDKIKTNNFIYEYSGQSLDFSGEEKQSELRQYVHDKENKYYQQIEEYYMFIESLKSSPMNAIMEENSRLYDDGDSLVNDNKSRKSEASKVSKENEKSMGMIKDEIEDEEKLDNSINKRKVNKRINKRKSSKSPDNTKKNNKKKK